MSAFNLNEYHLTSRIDSVQAGGDVIFPIPDGGELVSIRVSVDGVPTGGNVVATANIGGTAVTGGVVTIVAAGLKYGSASPTAANNVVADDILEIVFGSAPSGGAVEGGVTVTIRR